MASKDLFEFLSLPCLLPISCVECGFNMYCVRRSPEETGEKQTFTCAACGESKERIVGASAKMDGTGSPAT
jgi:hypothetical protein